MGNGGKGAKFSKGMAQAQAGCDKDRKSGSAAQPCPLKNRKLIKLLWIPDEAWCSERVSIRGTTQGYDDGETLVGRIENDRDVLFADVFSAKIESNQFAPPWDVLEVLPKKTDGKWDKHTRLSAIAEKRISDNRLKVKFLPDLPKTQCRADARFSLRPFQLSAQDYEIRIDADLKYIKGWAAETVKLGRSVRAGTGGLLDGKYKAAGYRWMKQVGGRRKFWDGSRWRDLPSRFRIRETNHDQAAFHKQGTKFVCYDGGEWPESFTDWAINAADKQQKIRKWATAIEDTWTGNFDIKRKECKSSASECCRYKTTHVKARFVEVQTHDPDVIIVADGDIRSNTALFFLGAHASMAAHEFGHYLGNPDEYKRGVWFDRSLNGDGAVNGVDNGSIMSDHMTGVVKRRHYRFICAQIKKMVNVRCGKSWTFKAVESTGATVGQFQFRTVPR